MSKPDYDLFVIGAGSGGVRAARMAAGSGARGPDRGALQSRLGHPCTCARR
jgi:pyruvate/2-oxoglutarate dehydrogenase complex dihydrolipoamide dehydrogenase (E3) component